jgi:hypothetical protein
MSSKKTVAKLADDMQNAAQADFNEHMNRICAGFELFMPAVAPVIKELRERGVTWTEIAKALRAVAAHIIEHEGEEEYDGQA